MDRKHLERVSGVLVPGNLETYLTLLSAATVHLGGWWHWGPALASALHCHPPPAAQPPSPKGDGHEASRRVPSGGRTLQSPLPRQVLAESCREVGLVCSGFFL